MKIKSILNATTLTLLWCLHYVSSALAGDVIVANTIHGNNWGFSKYLETCQLHLKIGETTEVKFIKYAGKPIFVNIQSPHFTDKVSLRSIQVISPPWREMNSTELSNYGSVSYSPITKLVKLESGESLLKSLHQGYWADLSFVSGSHTNIKINVSNIRLSTAYDEFIKCKVGLPILGYDLLRNNTLYVSSGKFVLAHEQNQLLEAIVQYSRFAKRKKIKKVLIDSYIDEPGRVGIQLKKSRYIADEVASALLEKGLSPALIEVRSHGGRYPEAQVDGSIGRVQIRVIQYPME